MGSSPSSKDGQIPVDMRHRAFDTVLGADPRSQSSRAGPDPSVLGDQRDRVREARQGQLGPRDRRGTPAPGRPSAAPQEAGAKNRGARPTGARPAPAAAPS